MSLTQVLPQVAGVQQILVGTVPPTTAPVDPSLPFLYYEIDNAGNRVALWSWSPIHQLWDREDPVTGTANNSEGLECGWSLGHNRQDYGPPAIAPVLWASTLTPYLHVDTVSIDPIPFQIWETAVAPVLVAEGVFPGGAKFASATQCSLVDGAGAPVMAIQFVPSVANPVAHFICIPNGGHSAMPADGSGFHCSFAQAYA